jgi:tRNA(Ile)-lysidine synthase
VRGGLSAAPDPIAVPPAFERRLNGPTAAPVALALSGGGDSLALLHLAKRWADRAGRRLVALTVDHRLDPASAGWTRFAAERADRLGIAHRTLVWQGPKPATGLPAAARAARHALLADAARAEGAAVILMGHTADDLAEAEAMRRAGASAPSPRAWSPSPAWPEGRGVFLLRPLLALRRAELRALLVTLGESWIDDPANDDPRFARSLARRRLATRSAPAPTAVEAVAPWPGLDAVRQGLAGELTVPRQLLATGGDETRRALGALALCAAGTTRAPGAAQLERIAARLATGGDFTASLAGARIEARGAAVRFCREAGERVRRMIEAAPLPLGESVFDGRLEIDAVAAEHRIGFLSGSAARLPPDQRGRLALVPAGARGALPAVFSPDGAVTCPLLGDGGRVVARSLTFSRLCATLGVIQDEASLWRVAKLTPGP